MTTLLRASRMSSQSTTSILVAMLGDVSSKMFLGLFYLVLSLLEDSVT